MSNHTKLKFLSHFMLYVCSQEIQENILYLVGECNRNFIVYPGCKEKENHFFSLRIYFISEKCVVLFVLGPDVVPLDLEA